MFRLRLVLLFLLPLLLASTAPKPTLIDVTLQDGENYVQVTLAFDRELNGYEIGSVGSKVRIDLPDAQCGLSEAILLGLRNTGNKLIPAMQVDQSGRFAVIVQLNAEIVPLGSVEGNRLQLRFYRAWQTRVELDPAVSLKISRNAGRQHNQSVYELRLHASANGYLRTLSAATFGKALLRPTEFARQSQADVVINGGFFSKAGEHLSTLVEGGTLLAPGVYPTRPMLAIDTEGKPHIGRFEVIGIQSETGAPQTCCCVAGATKFGVVSAVGAGPLLVEHGQPSISIAEDFIKPDIAVGQRSRTAVGLTKDGELMFIIVREERPAAHAGVSLQELAALLIDAGAVTALNLDGGGSTAMVVAGQLLVPSPQLERPVTNVLALDLRKKVSSEALPKAPDDGAEVSAEIEAAPNPD
jgi:hypothetical protein